MSIDDFGFPNCINDENENDMNYLFENIDFCIENISNEQQIDLSEQKSDENHSYPIVPTFENSINNDFSINAKDKIKKIRPGRGCEFQLIENENNFKKRYFKIFLKNSKKNKIPKHYVIDIHKIIEKELGIPGISRDAQRSINKYFRDYLPWSEKILRCLYDKKDDILSTYPELKNY